MKNDRLCERHPDDAEAWRAFEQCMLGNQYGTEETRDAWSWFQSGWHCATSCEPDDPRRDCPHKCLPDAPACVCVKS